MKGRRLLVSLFVTVAVVLGLTLPAAAQVEPPTVEADIGPGKSITVEKTVTTPEIPPLIDILLLEDETGSFWDDIDELQDLAPEIWDAIAASGADFTMGVAGFRDFAQPHPYTPPPDPWGWTGDWVYRLLQDLTTTKTDFETGVDSLTAGGGADWPEAQLEALHYLATPTHAAIDSNGDGDTTDSIDTPTGLQPTWRPGAVRVVLLATDATCHVNTDSARDGGGNTVLWPGDAGTVDAATTAGILSGAGIIVIGLTPLGAGTIPQIDTLAAGTGGSVQATTDTGDDIKEAILAGLEALTTDVWWEVDADPGLTVTLDPVVHSDVEGETTVTFTETITVAKDATVCETLEATVTFYANNYDAGEGGVVGEQTISVHVIDDIPPEVSCVPAENPHGKNVPGGKAKGKGQGVNPDGFYQLFAEDDLDPYPIIFIMYCEKDACPSPDDWTQLRDEEGNPFWCLSGTVVKLTQAPGAPPSFKKMGSSQGQAGAVTWHITIPNDALIIAVDNAGNVGWCYDCFVPPPPK